MKLQIEINKQVQFRKFHNFDNLLHKIFQYSLEYSTCNAKIASVSVLLCDNTHISYLNQQFRNKNYATNVLSFPDGETMENICYIGDIAISIEKLKEEALFYKKNFKTHFLHMFTHGMLHLLGFDHQTDHEMQEMEKIEDEILLRL